MGALPEGMTAEKLRYIADWLDIYDRMADQYVSALVAGGGLVPTDAERAKVAVRSKEVQTDLRAWANAIEGLDVIKGVAQMRLALEQIASGQTPCLDCGRVHAGRTFDGPSTWADPVDGHSYRKMDTRTVAAEALDEAAGA